MAFGSAVVVGAGSALLNKLLTDQGWFMTNLDTGEELQGQFPTTSNSRSVSSEWGRIESLNSAMPVLNFLRGNTDKISFSSIFYKRDLADVSPVKLINTLISWTRRDEILGRPPVLRFRIGDGSSVGTQVIINSISSISFSSPDITGAVRGVTFSVEMSKFTRFSLSDEAVTNTRYHRASSGETYELIAQREYGNPLLGDIIRKQPEQLGKALLSPGDVVKLPTVEGVRGQAVVPTSIPLSTSYGRFLSKQKALREEVFERLLKDRNVFGRPKTDDPAFSGIVIPPGFLLLRSLDFTAGLFSRVNINWLGARTTSQPLTFIGWVKFPPVAGAGFTVWNAGQFGTSGWQLAFDSSSSLVNSVTVVVRQNGGPQLSKIQSSLLGLSHDAWYHVAMIYGGDLTTLRLFINGVEVSLSTSISTLTAGVTIFYQSFPSFDAGWFLGYHLTGVTQSFDGKQANVGIYNAALTPAQVLEDYNGGSPHFNRLTGTAVADLIAWYQPLDTDDPNILVTDSSGLGNNGFGLNMSLSSEVP